MRTADARALHAISDGFIDKIATDPPWGLFDQTIGDMDAFYQAVFRELLRVTKPGGIIVLLLGRTAAAERLVAAASGQRQLVQRYDILLSGKKAMVVKYQRAVHLTPPATQSPS